MSNFSKQQNHGYVVIDYGNVTERGLKDLVKAFKRAGSPVTDVEATNRATRKNGVRVKAAKFFFENGQKITLFIGDQGDIFQLTLNSTKQPLPDVDSERELAKEIHKLLERNQASFDKRQAAKQKKVIKDTSNTKPLSRSLGKRLEEAKESLQSHQDAYNEAAERNTAIKTTLEQSTSQVEELENQLAQEKAETKALEKQLEELR